MKKISLTALLTALIGLMLWSCKTDTVDTVTLTVPANVTLRSATTTQIVIGWETVKGAEKYEYRFKGGTTTSISTTTQNSVTFADLTAATQYTFAVRATAGNTESDWSTVLTVETAQPEQPEPVKLAAPANVMSTSASETTISFGWSKVDGATAYTYRLQNSEGAEVKSGSTAALSVTVEGLTAGSSYLFGVMATGDGVNYISSDYSSSLTCSTSQPTQSKLIEQFELPESENDGLARAFPGAEGGGMYTTGGRGGKVLHVTNLTDNNTEGSLRWAVNQSGARTIVFDIDGVIVLNSKLEIKNGDLTIAGQSAPGDGICLRNYSTVVKADNVIIRYMRFRPGDEAKCEDDAIWGRYRKNVVLDHCSMSWSMDECASFYTNRNFTMQWCILAESLHNSEHAKGSHGYGAIWGGASASFHHNLLAHHDSRNPRLDSPNTYAENNSDTDIKLSERAVDFRNNVIYNFCNFPAYGGEGITINFVGNYYKWGPASLNGSGDSYNSSGTLSGTDTGHRRKYFYQVDGKYTTGGVTYDYGAAKIFRDGNSNTLDTSVSGSNEAGETVTADNLTGFVINNSTLSSVNPAITWLDKNCPIMYGSTPCRVTSHTAQAAFDKVTEYAGASLHRDAVDVRVCGNVKEGTASTTGSHGSINGIIDTQSDGGGWPQYAGGTAAKDSDGDGIPDSLETEWGLDPANSADGAAKTIDPQGRYTNLELYLHYLVKATVKSQTDGGSYISLE